jgi:hypothetical protein
MKKMLLCVALLSLLFCGFMDKPVRYNVYGIANYVDGEINIFTIYRGKDLDQIYETAMRDDVAFKRDLTLTQVHEIQDDGLYLLVDVKTMEYSLIKLQEHKIKSLR